MPIPAPLTFCLAGIPRDLQHGLDLFLQQRLNRAANPSAQALVQRIADRLAHSCRISGTLVHCRLLLGSLAGDHRFGLCYREDTAICFSTRSGTPPPSVPLWLCVEDGNGCVCSTIVS